MKKHTQSKLIFDTECFDVLQMLPLQVLGFTRYIQTIQKLTPNHNNTPRRVKQVCCSHNVCHGLKFPNVTLKTAENREQYNMFILIVGQSLTDEVFSGFQGFIKNRLTEQQSNYLSLFTLR